MRRAALAIAGLLIASDCNAQMLTYEAVEFSCQRRYTVDIAKGLCWGYISGMLDSALLRLNTPGRRVLCVDPNADKDKVIDRIFSFVEEPKNKKSAASPFIGMAILAALTCKVPGAN